MFTSTLADATDPSSSRLLESFERRVDEVARAIAGPVLSSMQTYAAYSRTGMRDQVFETARRHALLTLRTARAGRPPLEHELEFARRMGASRATAAPLGAVMQGCHMGTRIMCEWIANEAGSDPRELRAALTLTRACFEYGRATGAAVVEGYARECGLASDAWNTPQFVDNCLMIAGSISGARNELLVRVMATDSLAATCLRLTARERDLLELLAQGCSNKQIALRLQISLSTTKEYVSRILQKTTLPNRAAVAAAFSRNPLPRAGPQRM